MSPKLTVIEGTPMWIWSVVVDGALYVRDCNGVGSRAVLGCAEAKGGTSHGGRQTKM